MDSLSRDYKKKVPDTFPKRLETRDVQSLRGTGNKKVITPPIPSTKIPEQYHVKQVSGTPSTDPDLKSEYDEKTKVWNTTIFPSLKPGGRQEVLLLDKWLNDMLADNLAKNLDPIDSVKEAQDLYSACFHEICRQVYVQCAERGKLMEKIWNRYLQLFDHILKIREREKFSQTQKLEQQKAVYQRLYKEKDEKFNKAYLQLAADKEKITMSKDKLERVVLVLQEEYKKKVKQEAALKKAIKKMQNQITRQQLSLSSPSSFTDTKTSPDYNQNREDDDGKKRVRIFEGLQSSTSGDSRKDQYYDSDDHEFNRASSSLSLQSTDSFSRYDDDEEEVVDENSEILNSEDIDFSNNNLILVNKLEYVTKSLRGIHKTLRKSSTFESDDNSDLYATTQQLGTVLEAIVDVVNRLEHPENVQEQKTPTQIRALSTLSALRAPIDKAVQTMELEVSEAIPRAYANYFVKSFRVPVVHVKDKRYVFACMSYIYTQKIIDDEECQAKNVPRPAMSQYLYDLFLRVFGMRIWSEMHLLDFLASLRKYMQQNLRVKMFARFANIGEELCSPYTTDDLNFYLHVLSRFRPNTGKNLTTDENVSEMKEGKDGKRTVTIKTAIETINFVFPEIEAIAREGLIRVIESCSQLDDTDGLTQVVDLDKYMEVLLEEYHLRCNNLSSRFQRILEENVSAPLPDNILLYDEFLICMNLYQPGVAESEVIAMYRQILDFSSSLNSVETSTVLDVVRKHNFLCWKIYSSKIDKTITDYYLWRFMDFVWETTKLDLQDKLRKVQLDSTIAPKVSSLLQDRVRNLQLALSSQSGQGALSCYRQLIVQIFFSSKKNNRIIGGELTVVEEPENEEEYES